MDRIYAPWRSAYFTAPKNGECPFCAVQREARNELVGMLYRGARWFVLLNAYPYTSGHIMIVAARHVKRIGDLTAEELGELPDLLARCERAIEAAYRPDGLNIGINIGIVAPMAFFPFSGMKDSFFGVLHGQGEDRKDEAGLPRHADETDDDAAAETQRQADVVHLAHTATLLDEIDAALARIDAGDYGLCIDCDEPIDLRRLQAYPAALRCARCQQQAELQQARLGRRA